MQRLCFTADACVVLFFGHEPDQEEHETDPFYAVVCFHKYEMKHKKLRFTGFIATNSLTQIYDTGFLK